MPQPETMQQINEAQRRRGHEWRAHKAMRDSAMMLKGRDRPLDRPQHVEISRLGRQHHRKRGQRGLAVEPGAAHARASQKMRDRFQVSPRQLQRLNIPMPRLSRQQIDRMRQNVNHGLQRFHGALRAAGQVENQRAPAHAAHTTTENRERRLRQPCQRASSPECPQSVSSTPRASPPA